MQYVSFGKLGCSVSRLGFGAMRLPAVRDENGTETIDRERAVALIRAGIDGGITYVDAAYGYHGGESEIMTGLALKNGYRDKVRLTTKLPQWKVSEEADMDRLLDEQLKKLDVPYLDVYLVHALNGEAFERMKGFQYGKFLDRAKKDGRIRHAGFSFHDERNVFFRISGMSTESQLRDNLKIFERIKPGNLTDDQERFTSLLKETYMSRQAVGCTGCNYCQPCPQGVAIPKLFSAYNHAYRYNDDASLMRKSAELRKNEADASRCIACGACESACPQALPIIETLSRIRSKVQGE